MHEQSAVFREVQADETPSSSENKNTALRDMRNQTAVGFAAMIIAGALAGMMLSFALCGSFFNVGGIVAGAIAGFLMHS